MYIYVMLLSMLIVAVIVDIIISCCLLLSQFCVLCIWISCCIPANLCKLSLSSLLRLSQKNNTRSNSSASIKENLIQNMTILILRYHEWFMVPLMRSHLIFGHNNVLPLSSPQADTRTPKCSRQHNVKLSGDQYYLDSA